MEAYANAALVLSYFLRVAQWLLTPAKDRSEEIPDPTPEVREAMGMKSGDEDEAKGMLDALRAVDCDAETSGGLCDALKKARDEAQGLVDQLEEKAGTGADPGQEHEAVPDTTVPTPGTEYVSSICAGQLKQCCAVSARFLREVNVT